MGFPLACSEGSSPKLSRSGYSSGSAGGSILDSTQPATLAEPPQQSDPALPKQVPAEGEVPLTVPGVMPETNPTMGTLETEMMDRLKKKMLELEESFTREILQKKRLAEEELEKEYNAKRTKLDDEMFEMQENMAYQQTQLAMASEQLQERMLLVTDEQKSWMICERKPDRCSCNLKLQLITTLQ